LFVLEGSYSLAPPAERGERARERGFLRSASSPRPSPPSAAEEREIHRRCSLASRIFSTKQHGCPRSGQFGQHALDGVPENRRLEAAWTRIQDGCAT